MSKQKNDKAIDKPKKILEELEPAPVEAVHAELDPEVVEALNARKPRKPKSSGDVDYIPELERDESIDADI